MAQGSLPHFWLIKKFAFQLGPKFKDFNCVSDLLKNSVEALNALNTPLFANLNTL
jgi:hypothetical protein